MRTKRSSSLNVQLGPMLSHHEPLPNFALCSWATSFRLLKVVCRLVSQPKSRSHCVLSVLTRDELFHLQSNFSCALVALSGGAVGTPLIFGDLAPATRCDAQTTLDSRSAGRLGVESRSIKNKTCHPQCLSLSLSLALFRPGTLPRPLRWFPFVSFRQSSSNLVLRRAAYPWFRITDM